jgi:putative ABC transport system substrate-binding protein
MRSEVCCLWTLNAMVSLAPVGPVLVHQPRVIAVLSQEAAPYRAALQGFQDQLKKSSPGIEVVVHVLARGKDGTALVSTIRAQDPALVLALGSAAVETARQLGDVPVVAGMVLHPSDVTRGAQFTGVFLEFPADVAFSYLKRILPGQRRVAVLYNPAENQPTIDQATRAARPAGLDLLARKVQSASGLPDMLKSLTNSADVLWGIADTLVLTPETARPILLFSLQNRIPFVGLSAPWVRAGALYALERDYPDVGRQCAELAGQLLAGQSPASLPPVPPRKVLYLINRRTADQLKLSIPRDVLRAAEEVIE